MIKYNSVRILQKMDEDEVTGELIFCDSMVDFDEVYSIERYLKDPRMTVIDNRVFDIKFELAVSIYLEAKKFRNSLGIFQN